MKNSEDFDPRLMYSKKIKCKEIRNKSIIQEKAQRKTITFSPDNTKKNLNENGMNKINGLSNIYTANTQENNDVKLQVTYLDNKPIAPAIIVYTAIGPIPSPTHKKPQTLLPNTMHFPPFPIPAIVSVSSQQHTQHKFLHSSLGLPSNTSLTQITMQTPSISQSPLLFPVLLSVAKKYSVSEPPVSETKYEIPFQTTGSSSDAPKTIAVVTTPTLNQNTAITSGSSTIPLSNPIKAIVSDTEQGPSISSAIQTHLQIHFSPPATTTATITDTSTSSTINKTMGTTQSSPITIYQGAFTPHLNIRDFVNPSAIINTS
ncbi:hypothetical protein POVWA2_083550 [Plasmodium ovale wallikeri]|uniref:Uncharacterized protein n=1 Tax=Plasmodium ovale wallikeri TaxID=864142 RepID=A0A1A9APM6_PLAOA|nr:hypothetical protein POVWA1_067330 [Plasmodium ovale wallikeri]SBT58170.1 hypothetical protein POVWA2_083550 [Plasmodium ovale wallikeri]